MIKVILTTTKILHSEEELAIHMALLYKYSAFSVDTLNEFLEKGSVKIENEKTISELKMIRED